MTNKDLKTGVVGELRTKSPARVATMANITLEGLQTVNGVALAADDIVLVNLQDDKTENGVYIASTGEWQRAVWFDDELDAKAGTLILTVEGSQRANTLWQTVCADSPIVFGTSEIEFAFFATSSAGGGGTYLLSGNNLDDVDDPAISRQNLGLVIGTNVQAQNANLQSFAGLVGSANKGVYFTALNTLGLFDYNPLLFVPTGAIFAFAFQTPPAGYLECDGSAISRTVYAALFAAIGTQFGAGDGSTTFNIPDTRGYFIRGWANGGSIDSGRVFGSTQLHAAEKHRHLKGESATIETPDGRYNGNGLTINGVTYGSGNQSGGGGYSSQTSSIQVPSVSGGTVNVAAENRPTNLALMYCIKY